jgi:hypothetical protein
MPATFSNGRPPRPATKNERHPSVIQRKCSACQEDRDEDEKPIVQRKSLGTHPATNAFSGSHVGEAVASGGIGLDTQTRAFFEPRLGYDLSSIRVHSNPVAASSATAVDAKAYTIGSDIVFGDGEYSPADESGRRLLAHELAHVLQNSSGDRDGLRTIKRDPKDTPKKKAPPKIPTGPASGSPNLDVSYSVNGDPCACLVAIHADERGARVIARLLHANCSYNLALVMPDSGNRPVDIPNVGSMDPNELFPQDVVEECMTDEEACKKRLVDDASSTDRAKTLKYAQTQFFLAVKDCSDSFTLPVIGLHDNRTDDTAPYLKLVAKKTINVDDLKGVDIDKTKPKKKGEADPAKKSMDNLRTKLKGSGGMLDKKGSTNIFRWCALPDIGKCHVGDPQHPDNVVWVTNEEDFKKLAATSVNVALQTKAGPESLTDLSTVFLHLKDLADRQMFEELLDLLTGDFIWKVLLGLDEPSIDPDKLRFINIEGSGLSHDKLPVSERVRNYNAVVDVLKSLPGLYCCGDKPARCREEHFEGPGAQRSRH